MTVAQLGYFIDGDFSSITLLDFNWDATQVYYFLIKLQDNGAAFEFKKEEKNEYESKIHIKGNAFSANAFYKGKHSIKKNGLPKDYELIDNLFR